LLAAPSESVLRPRPAYLFSCGTSHSHELPNIDVFTSSTAFVTVAATDVFISSMDFIMVPNDVFTSSVDFTMDAAMSRMAFAAGAGMARQVSQARSVDAGASWAITGLATIAQSDTRVVKTKSRFIVISIRGFADIGVLF
jgi:hypothetical protein